MSAPRMMSTRRTVGAAIASAFAIVALATGAFGRLAFPPIGPARVAAADPSASPTATPVLTPAPAEQASPLDTPAPSPLATETPTPPTPPAPAPASPAPSAVASPAANAPTPTVAPTVAPGSPSPPTGLEYALTAGQQPGVEITPPIPLYRLVVPTTQLAASADAPHAAGGGDCASCHAAHSAQGRDLLTAASQGPLCYRCHGTGTALDVQSQFDAAPPNDAAVDAYYSHPVADSAVAHSGAGNEFEGSLNRHAVCADCHNPHAASSARPQQSLTGWTAPGPIENAGGVALADGAGGPRYRLVRPGSGLTYEYELCLACHSGWTELPTRPATNPSWWALDKGVELSPIATSYHPIAASGRNQTAQMAASLAGSSPFKAWGFSIDATVRCTSCHGDPGSVNQTASGQPLMPPADTSEASHASPNRGLLTAPYRDRLLKLAGESYAAGDFALCYLCHAERPFVDTTRAADQADTLFPLHGAHVAQLAGHGGEGTSIDTPGAGAGFAICAECHFRIHSTAIPYAPGDAAPVARNGGTSLVGFAPNVTGAGGEPPTWRPPGADGVGSCTLTCHAAEHLSAESSYTTAPGAGFDASPTSGSRGASGLLVTFRDQTRYADETTATWVWDFGDGHTATGRQPIHTYLEPGTYTVRLTVTRSGPTPLSSTLTRSGYIVVTP